MVIILVYVCEYFCSGINGFVFEYFLYYFLFVVVRNIGIFVCFYVGKEGFLWILEINFIYS